MFFLSEDGRAKLKTFSGTTRAGKHIIKIEVEYPSAMDMAYDLEGLEKVQAAQKPKPKPRAAKSKPSAPKKITRQKPLALPAPEPGE